MKVPYWIALLVLMSPFIALALLAVWLAPA